MLVNFENVEHRKDFLSVDQQTAISAHGEIFKVGDTVKHESQEDEIAVIQHFYLDIENDEVRAQTTKGNAAIVFLYKPNGE